MGATHLNEAEFNKIKHWLKRGLTQEEVANISGRGDSLVNRVNKCETWEDYRDKTWRKDSRPEDFSESPSAQPILCWQEVSLDKKPILIEPIKALCHSGMVTIPAGTEVSIRQDYDLKDGKMVVTLTAKGDLHA